MMSGKLAFDAILCVALVGGILIGTYVIASIETQHRRDLHWEHMLIEKGHGTYKDGKFEWKEPQ